MLKRILSILLCLILFVSILSVLSACGGDDAKDSDDVGDIQKDTSLEGTNSKKENEYDNKDSGKIEF